MKATEEINKVNVEIFGQEFTFKSKEADKEYILRLSSFVEQKMKEIVLETGKKFSYHQLAILAAMNIADELFQERTKHPDNELILIKTKQLIQLLDEGILGDPII